MVKLYASAKLVKNYRIDVDDGRAHAVCLDLDQESGGTDLGPSALELALMSFVGCYATIFLLTAKRMRLTVKDLEIKAEAVKSEEAGTITQAKVEVIVKSDMPNDRLQRIHQLTAKGCPVGIIFDKAGIKTAYDLRVEK
jgi:putative redox protein